MFPNCCVLVPVHMKDNTRLKYPAGSDGPSDCLRAVLATSRIIRKYLLTSPYLHQLNKQKKKIFYFSQYFSTSSGIGMPGTVCTNSTASHRIPDPGLAESL